MKKLNFYLLGLIVMILASCTIENEGSPEPSSFLDNLESTQTLEGGENLRMMSSSCNTTEYGSFPDINKYHAYPNRTIDVSCVTNGGTVSITVQAHDLPNRYTIVNPSTGAVVVQSSWLGVANYPGPWGQSLNASSQTTLQFNKSVNQYILKVETQTPPDHSYSPTTDYWSASISCTCSSTCSPVCPSGFTCNNGQCICSSQCGGVFSDKHLELSSYHTYTKNVNLTCATNGATVHASVQAMDIPNRFFIKTTGGTIVASTGWLGVANYPGPWGQSLNNPSSGTMQFTKNSNSYILEVLTLTAPNGSYSPSTDNWQVNITCPGGN